MTARKMAAQYAAYVWFENTQSVPRSDEEKSRFARRNWRAFMPVADEGLGRLLLKLRRAHKRRKQSMSWSCT